MTTPEALPDKSKNWMGVVALITSLVCLPVLGLIFGLLGLGAAKRGEATNRGMAMFATIWSAAWLAIGAAGGAYLAANWDGGRVLVGWAGTAGTDVVNVDRAIDEFQAANEGLVITNIGYDGENYYVGDIVVPAESKNADIKYYINGTGGHCLAISNTSGFSTSSVSFGHGASCEGTPQEVLTP